MRLPFFSMIAAVLCIFVLTFLYFLSIHMLFSVDDMEFASVTISNMTDNKDRYPLDYGIILPGMNVKRTLSISSPLNVPTKVSIRADGSLSHWMHLSDNNFIILPQEQKIVDVYVFVPHDVRYGSYNATVYINYRKVSI